MKDNEIYKDSEEYKKFVAFHNVVDNLVKKSSFIHELPTLISDKDKKQKLLFETLDEMKILYVDYNTLMNTYKMSRGDVIKLLNKKIIEK